jgi:hypothetical protein
VADRGASRANTVEVMSPADPIRAASVITTGDNGLHHEHMHGTRKPELVLEVGGWRGHEPGS